MRLPKLLRQFLAEFIGTLLLVLLGDGSIIQVAKQEEAFTNVAFGYGLALMVGILVSGAVSGGHLNPAVTLAMTVRGKCCLIQLPVYWAAQYLGAFCGAGLLFAVYADHLEQPPGLTLEAAGWFATFPSPESSTMTLVFDQMLGTAVLVLIVMVINDQRHINTSSGLAALLLGLGLTAIHLSLALNSGCAINPARDFSP